LRERRRREEAGEGETEEEREESAARRPAVSEGVEPFHLHESESCGRYFRITLRAGEARLTHRAQGAHGGHGEKNRRFEI
jgi:hypothetical protein